MIANMRYKSVFICCSGKDRETGNGLIRTKSAISKLKKIFEEHSIRYWIDESDGVESSMDIVKALKESQVLLFVSSVNSNNSEKCINEVFTAKSLGKEILVFSLDNSLFNDRVILFMSALDNIDYYANAERAIERLLESLCILDEDGGDSILQSKDSFFSEPNSHTKESNAITDWFSLERLKGLNGNRLLFNNNNKRLILYDIVVAVLLVVILFLCYNISSMNKSQEKQLLILADKIERINHSVDSINVNMKHFDQTIQDLIGEEEFTFLAQNKDLISVSNAVYVSNSSVKISIKNKTSKKIKKIYLENGYMHYLGDDYDFVPIEEAIDGLQEKTVLLKLKHRSSCSSRYEELSFNNGTLWVEYSDGKKFETKKFALTVKSIVRKERNAL